MPKEIYLVKVGMTMTEGSVDEWYVEDGSLVSEGADLYRLETEKVNMDVEAESTGIVKHVVPAGTTLEPGHVIGWIYAEDEVIPEVLPVPKHNPNIASLEEATATPPPESTIEAVPLQAGTRIKASPKARRLARERGINLEDVVGTGSGGRIVESDIPVEAEKPSEEKIDQARIPSSPVARKLASQLGIDLASIEGTGPRGRITREDVEAASKSTRTEPGSSQAVPLTGLRRTIAKRMFDSLHSTAQLSMDMEVQMDKAVQLREELNANWMQENVRLAYTDLIIVAVTRALSNFPIMNAAFRNDSVEMFEHVNMGFAVALDDGLIVPVVHDAHTKPLKNIARETNELTQLARTNSLSLDQVSNGTFTISSLGMFGVDGFTPILNPPQTGIIGVGRIYDATRWEEDSPVKCRNLRLSLTWDHQVVDGAPAAQFLGNVRDLLEAPDQLIDTQVSD